MYRHYALPISTAGADIKQLAKLSYAEAYTQDVFKEWTRLTNIRKPVRCWKQAITTQKMSEE